MLQTMTPTRMPRDGGQGQPSHRGGDLHEDVEALGRRQLVERRLPEQGVFRHGRTASEDDSDSEASDDAAGRTGRVPGTPCQRTTNSVGTNRSDSAASPRPENVTSWPASKRSRASVLR